MGDEVAPTRRAQETFSHRVRLTEAQYAALEWIAERPGSACPQLEEGEVWTPLGQWQVRSQDAAWRVWEGISSNVGPEAVFIQYLGHRQPNPEPAL